MMPPPRKTKGTLCLCLLLALSLVACSTPGTAGVSSFEAGFSPDGSSLHLLLKGIRQSRKSILVAAYSFTSKPIAAALLEAHTRGVRVQVVADKQSNTGRHSVVTLLARHGVPVRLNGNYQIFHHKFMIFDGLHVETGSFNYSSAAARKNAENVLMVYDNKDLADRYTGQWSVLWNEAEDIGQSRSRGHEHHGL